MLFYPSYIGTVGFANCLRLGIACILVAGATALALGDDASVEFGIGGAVHLIKGSHPSIRMESEVVKIDRLPHGRIHARFVFKNYGKATDVEIGFPGIAAAKFVDKGDAALENFRSMVDGKPIAVQMVDNTPPVTSREEGNGRGEVWYLKNVHFAANQTHVIEDDYTGGGGWSYGHYSYKYVLETGASWKGTIGHATIICDLKGLGAYSPPELSPDRYTQSGSVVTWERRNLKPTEADNVLVKWVPAFTNIKLNGQELFNESEDLTTDDLIHFCLKRDRAILVPAQLAAKWLNATVTPMAKETFRISIGRHWVEFTTGSKTLTSWDGRHTVMAFPASILTSKDLKIRFPEMQEGGDGLSVHVLGLASLVRALGGKAELDTKEDRLNLWLGPPRG